MSAGDVSPDAILVVVPTLNEEAHIADCLRSLTVGDPVLAGMRVVVADGGSSDRTREIVREIQRDAPNLELIDNPGRLQAAALNRAVVEMAEPRHRILVRCDAHSAYPPGFVMDVAGLLVEKGAASLTVPMDARGTGCLQRAVAFITDTPLGSGGSAHRGGQRSDWVDHGHHAGFDLDWFRRLGGYDETFSHNEDAEYDRRLTGAGGRIWLAADLRIGIVPRGSVRTLARQYGQYGRGRARTVLKHRMRPRLRQMIPVVHVLALVVSLALLFVPGSVATLGYLYPLTYGALMTGAALWAALRMQSACGLWAGVILAVMHTTWGIGFLAQVIRGVGPVSDTPPLSGQPAP